MEDLAKFAEPYLIENQNYFLTKVMKVVLNDQRLELGCLNQCLMSNINFVGTLPPASLVQIPPVKYFNKRLSRFFK